MKRLMTLLLTVALTAGISMAAPKKLRQRLTFDQGWQFRLCKNHDEVERVLDSLGVMDPHFVAHKANGMKNKVADDTEPEQAKADLSC